MGSATCEDYCVIGKSIEDKIYWCYTFTEPILTIGWEYNMDANTDASSTPNKHLRWDLIFYLTSQLKITSTIDIYRLLYNQMVYSIPQIDWKIETGAIWNELG